MHRTFLWLEMTDSHKTLVPCLSTVSTFRFRVPLQPTGFLPVALWVDHHVLDHVLELLGGNRVQQLRSDSATNVFQRSTTWNHQLFWAMNVKLVAASTSQHITHGSGSRHDPPTTIRKHSVGHLAFPCTETYPCPVKLPRQIKTTLHLDALIDCPVGLLSQFHSVASTPFVLPEKQCLVGCDGLETVDVRAAVCADLEDKD